MDNYFDIHGTIGGAPAYFRVMHEEDFDKLGSCYLIHHEDTDLGYICRLPDGQFKAIDYTQLTQAEIDEIGRNIDLMKSVQKQPAPEPFKAPEYKPGFRIVV